MSWDIELIDENGKTVKVPLFEEGGTYAVGGSEYADLNVTYNYSWFYFQCLDEDEGIRWLNNKKAEDTVQRLEKAVEKLGTHKWKDYWAPTPGNAGHALSILLQWAKANPKATWKVT